MEKKGLYVGIEKKGLSMDMEKMAFFYEGLAEEIRMKDGGDCHGRQQD
ncbi:MAG: hypothetical protein ACI4DN_07170 [Lachnospiraceae bacterium]